jgi:hypothetical protein
MKKVFRLFFMSVCFGLVGMVLWTGQAYGKRVSPVTNPPGCQKNLEMCTSDLGTCEDDLAACQIFPGDGYTDSSFGTIGHGPALSYTDNQDGTFTDNNTGYMWEIKDDNDDVHDKDNTYSWSSSGTEADGTLFSDFLAELNDVAGGGMNCFAGHCDWCVPNLKRLQSIVDYSTSNPASSVPGATAASSYWSSTTDADGPAAAWVVFFFNGVVGSFNKNTLLLVRAVRPCP